MTAIKSQTKAFEEGHSKLNRIPCAMIRVSEES